MKNGAPIQQQVREPVIIKQHIRYCIKNIHNFNSNTHV